LIWLSDKKNRVLQRRRTVRMMYSATCVIGTARDFWKLAIASQPLTIAGRPVRSSAHYST
jgi:hypothetical protein